MCPPPLRDARLAHLAGERSVCSAENGPHFRSHPAIIVVVRCRGRRGRCRHFFSGGSFGAKCPLPLPVYPRLSPTLSLLFYSSLPLLRLTLSHVAPLVAHGREVRRGIDRDRLSLPFPCPATTATSAFFCGLLCSHVEADDVIWILRLDSGYLDEVLCFCSPEICRKLG